MVFSIVIHYCWFSIFGFPVYATAVYTGPLLYGGIGARSSTEKLNFDLFWKGCTRNWHRGRLCLYTTPAYNVPSRLSAAARTRLRREGDFQQDREVVGDTAGGAGSGVGAEGFVAGMGGIAGQ